MMSLRSPSRRSKSLHTNNTQHIQRARQCRIVQHTSEHHCGRSEGTWGAFVELLL